MLVYTAVPVHTTARVYTTASACNAALVYTTMPARIRQTPRQGCAANRMRRVSLLPPPPPPPHPPAPFPFPPPPP
eukprot:2807275-Pyramimonas_sp.AAC.1